MNLKVAEVAEGVVAGPGAATELVEDGGSEGNLSCGVEVQDSLEGAGSTVGSSILLPEDQLVKSRHDVLEASNVDLLLGDTGVGGLLLLVDALGEVEARTEGAADKIDHVAGNRGREHEVLALDLLRIREVSPDLVDLLGEPLVQKAISLVHDKGVQVGGFDAGVWVGKNVEKTSGSTDENVAALTLCLLQHHALLGSSDGGLDDEAGVGGDLLGLYANLLGELTCGRDDDGPDVVRLGSLVAAGLLAELGVACDDALDDGDKEAERLAGTSLCLCNTVVCQLMFCIAGAGAMPYMSTPLRASLMVLCWTSVMVSIFICLVMVSTTLRCTRPRLSSSLKVVAGPSSAMASSAWTSCATCCHLQLLWKLAMEALAERDKGIRRAAGVLVSVRGVRRVLEETATLEMLFDRTAGHLLNAPNMTDGVTAEIRRRVLNVERLS